MVPDSYKVGLGNDDPSVRRSADADFISFWEEQAGRLSWHTPWRHTLEWNLPFARWFSGGMINASYNALDIHKDSSKPAIMWEGEDGESKKITYGELLEQVAKLAGALISLGVKPGDRVAICLPMVPELPSAMLACARIGATHVVIFSGFSASAIRDRVEDCGAKVLITADGAFRRGKLVNLKGMVDTAVSDLKSVEHVIVLERAKNPIRMNRRDLIWDDLIRDAPSVDAIPLPSDHPLYILYTSGTTGKPKGVLHGTGGYLTHVYATFGWAFDIRDSDVYFCTADIGWVTGHSYVVYAPLMHGASIVMYEGAPDYPDSRRIWQILEKYGVSIFYTTPTLLRMLMRFGDDITLYDLAALRHLGSVGEPINPEVWRWYYESVGAKRCPVIDTWWQTETGGMMISALPGIETIALKPGSGTLPVPGVHIDVVDESGNSVRPNQKGHLIIRDPWPGMMLTLWNNDAKYMDAYWSKYAGCYYAGDYALRDEDGYVWLLGRADDILKVAGHRIGTAELESCIVSHDSVAESAVCGIDDEIKGQAIAAFVVLREGIKGTDALKDELVSQIRSDIGAIAAPKIVCFVRGLPKTRSGKIMRRILQSIVKGSKIGDTSTLEDAEAVSEVQAAFKALGRG